MSGVGGVRAGRVGRRGASPGGPVRLTVYVSSDRKDTDITVGQLVQNVSGKTGENIVVRRFKRIELGVND